MNESDRPTNETHTPFSLASPTFRSEGRTTRRTAERFAHRLAERFMGRRGDGPNVLDVKPMDDTRPDQSAPRDRDAAVWSDLMRRAQDGDQAAYRRLLVGISPYLRAVARRYLREPHEAEDAVQDILMTLHAIRHTYDPGRPFRPWLAGVARYRLMDRLRGRRRISAQEVALTPAHETFLATAPNDGPDLWDRAALAAAIETLPTGQREAIEMLKLSEMSLKEAAMRSGQSIAALKVASHRGLRSLRRILTREASV
jgi:RNA polymerase sigma factor (sigma-70 family)